MARFRRLRAFLLGVVVALCASSMAWAQTSGSVGVTPVSVRHAGATATGINTSVVLEATLRGTSSDGVRRYGVNVPVSSGTLANLAKGAVRRFGAAAAAYSTFKAIVDAAGWAIDELQGQVVTRATAETKPAGTVMYCGGPEVRGACTTTQAGAVAVTRAVFGYARFYRDESGVFWHVCMSEGCGTVVFARREVSSATVDWGTGAGWPSPVSDQDLVDLLKNNPEAVNEVLRDPNTGAPIRTPELVDAMNQLRRQLEAANNLPPGSDVVVDPNYPTNPQASESAWPAFCDWASVVCDFIKWMKEEPDVQDKELPEEELQIEPQEWASGMPSTGSCPAPVSFTVTLAGYSQTAEFSYQPLCDFLSMLRPVILAMGAVVAGWIIAGRGMARNA